MARYRATVLGNRGEASRLGTKESGIHATVNGWDIGVRVAIDCINGEDKVYIYLTKGSNNPTAVKSFVFKQSEIDKL